MAIVAPKSEKKFDPVPAGNHVARVYRIIHVGSVPESWEGEEKTMNKIILGFELPNETKVFKEENGPQPYVISREFTLSMNEKANLRHLVEGILGVALTDDEANGFDVETLLGKTCLLNVVHKKSEKTGNINSNIQGASPIPKGMECPPAVNKEQLLNYDNFDVVLFGSLPEYLRLKIQSSAEYKVKFPDGTPF